MDWFNGLNAGDVLTLDYQMTFEGEVQPSITSLTLNGQDACSGSGSGNPTSSSKLLFEYINVIFSKMHFSIATENSQSSSASTENPATTTAEPTNPTTTSSSISCSAERYDYGRVLELSNLFYEAQRSGDLPDDNRVPWRGDSSLNDQGQNGEDLTGGYHDGNTYFTL